MCATHVFCSSSACELFVFFLLHVVNVDSFARLLRSFFSFFSVSFDASIAWPLENSFLFSFSPYNLFINWTWIWIGERVANGEEWEMKKKKHIGSIVACAIRYETHTNFGMENTWEWLETWKLYFGKCILHAKWEYFLDFVTWKWMNYTISLCSFSISCIRWQWWRISVLHLIERVRCDTNRQQEQQ